MYFHLKKKYQHGQECFSGDGIVPKSVDNTITNIGTMASKGMRETDKDEKRVHLPETVCYNERS